LDTDHTSLTQRDAQLRVTEFNCSSPNFLRGRSIFATQPYSGRSPLNGRGELCQPNVQGENPVVASTEKLPAKASPARYVGKGRGLSDRGRAAGAASSKAASKPLPLACRKRAKKAPKYRGRMLHNAGVPTV